jgi:hypothetical protein
MHLVMSEGLSHQFEISQSPNAQPEEYARAQMIGLETVLAEWHRVAENFDTLFAEFNKLGKGEKKSRLALSGSISNLQTALGEANTRVQLLSAKVGADDVASEQGSLSVWECVGSIQDEVLALGASRDTSQQNSLESVERDKFTQSKLGHMRTDLGEVSARSNNLGGSFMILSANYLLVVGQMKTSVSALETRLAGVEGAVASAPFGAHPGAGGSVTWDPPLAPTTLGGERGGVTASREDFGRLVGRVTEVERRVNTQGAGQDGSGAAYGVQIEQILVRMGDMESRVSDESVVIHENVFCSAADVLLWCRTNEVVSCGLYWDLFSVLIVMLPKQQTGKDRADETHSSDRTKSTPKENDLAVAMSHDRPKVLFGKSVGTGELVPLEDGFGARPTHAKWIRGSESYKAKLWKMLNTYLLGLSGSLPPTGGGPAGVFARGLVVEIRSQWTDVVTFIDSFMLKLCEVAKFPKATRGTMPCGRVRLHDTPSGQDSPLEGPDDSGDQGCIPVRCVTVSSRHAKVHLGSVPGASCDRQRDESLYDQRAGGPLRAGRYKGPAEEDGGRSCCFHFGGCSAGGKQRNPQAELRQPPQRRKVVEDEGQVK